MGGVVAVHPHVRGDKRSIWFTRLRSHGSPPRAWGQAGRRSGSPPGPRFTPTCVGTRKLPGGKAPSPPVHPHVRGDKRARSCSGVSRPGSPPRAWGQAHPAPQPAQSPRFTPTCVGTSQDRRLVLALEPVHPHVRGDKDSSRFGTIRLNGSPPRAWGQAPTRTPDLRPRRFTPTCVGTSAPRSTPRRLATVHPHVRGDKEVLDAMREYAAGSPPRAWGQGGPPPPEELRPRFTPTCVGTSAVVECVRRGGAVHPHVRGDKTTPPIVRQ